MARSSSPPSESGGSGRLALAGDTIKQFTGSMMAKFRKFVFKRNNITPKRQRLPWWSSDNALAWGGEHVGAFLMSEDSRSSPPLPDSPTPPSRSRKKRARSPSPSNPSMSAASQDLHMETSGGQHENASDDEVVLVPNTKKFTKPPPKKRAKTVRDADDAQPKKKGRKNDKDGIRIKVTRKESVASTVTLNKAPTTWTVPKEDTAYILDMSDDVVPMVKTDDGSLVPMDMATYIRGEDQDSWKNISGGSSNRPVKVKVFGKPEVPCRHVDVHCKGVSHCDQVAPDFLAGTERWEPDVSQREALFQAQQKLRERDGMTRLAQTVHFYNTVKNRSCMHGADKGDKKGKCDGQPVLKSLKKSYYVDSEHAPPELQSNFVGCSKWSSGQKDHLHVWIPAEVDVTILERLFNGERLDDLEDAKDYTGPCSFAFHPRHNRQTECPFLHIRSADGQPITGQMVPRPCPVTMAIYAPIDPKIRKAVVILRNGPHNHPIFPEEKPSYQARTAIEEAARAQGVDGVTSEKLNNASTTRSLLGGQTLDEVHPALANRRHIRRTVKKLKAEANPAGTEWAGLVSMAEEERKLPAEQRYIRVLTIRDDVHLCITMLLSLIVLLHEAWYFVFDFTFKRLAGQPNVADLVIALPRYNNKRITVARVYMDRSTEGAYDIMWEGIFWAIEEVTGRMLKLRPIHKEGNMRLIILDGEPAQIQSLGNKLKQINNPIVSGIPNSRDELLAHIARTCFFHWGQNANGTAESDDNREDAEILKDFVHYTTQEQIDQFYEYCENSSNQKVLNWYKNKKAYPWYFPSVNGFLSKVPPEDWALLPSTSNHAETAHVANNAASGIGLSLVEAVKLAKKQDMEVAESLARIDKTCILPNHLNTAKAIQSRNIIRRTKRIEQKKETRARNHEISLLEAEKKKQEAARKAAAAQKKTIDAKLKALKAGGTVLSEASSSSPDQVAEAALSDFEMFSPTNDTVGDGNEDFDTLDMAGNTGDDFNMGPIDFDLDFDTPHMPPSRESAPPDSREAITNALLPLSTGMDEATFRAYMENLKSMSDEQFEAWLDIQ